MLRRLVAVASICIGWACFVYGQGSVECETGCNSFWQGREWTTGCQCIDPYTCFAGSTYWADIDEGGDCAPVDPEDPDVENPIAKLYRCEGVCAPVCTNCPPGEACLQYAYVNQGSVYLTEFAREECTGIQD